MRRDWLIMLLLAAATIAVFWPVTRHEFINFDDPAYVTRNPIVREGLTWPGVKWAFGQLHGEATYWHPVTWLSHMLDCQLYGLKPAGHHLTSLLLHTLNTLLLFALLLRMTGRRGPSAVVAALFAIHPLQVDSVAWVAERKNLLSGFFFFLTISAYCRFAEVRSPKPEARSPDDASRTTSHASRLTHHASRIPFPVSRFNASTYYILSLVCFALGLMSKPTLVPLPFLLLLLDYWPLRRLAPFGVRGSPSRPASGYRLARRSHALVAADGSRRGTGGQKNAPTAVGGYGLSVILAKHEISGLVAEKLPFLALSAAASAVTIWAHESLGALASMDELPVTARLGNAVVAYTLYLRKLVWPAELSVFYLHPGRWPDAAVAASALLVLGITTIAVWQTRRRPFGVVGWLWFLGMLVPVIGLVQAHVQALADRFAYLPAIGVFLAFAWALEGLNSGAGSLAWMFHALVAADGSRRSIGGQKNAPTAVGGYGLVALVLGACVAMTSFQLRCWRNSLTLLQHAVQVEPANFVARVMLGNALFERRQLEAALGEYQEATRLRPDYPEAWVRAGAALTELDRPAEAMSWLTRAGELAPGWPEVPHRLALALLRQGRTNEARAAYQTLIRLMPATADARRDLADMLAEGGQYDDAVRCYCEALQLQPDFPAALNNLAMLRASCPEPEFRNGSEAVRLAEAACQLSGRREPNFLGTLAAAYAEAGRFPDAINTIQEALRLSRAAGDDDLVRLQTQMLQQFRAGKPFRRTP